MFPIECAPLRERLDDIPHLAQHLLDGIIKKLNIAKIRLTTADIDRFKRYDWPGNVRELENVIERAAILASNERLHFVLPKAGTRSSSTTGARPVALVPLERDRFAWKHFRLPCET